MIYIIGIISVIFFIWYMGEIYLEMPTAVLTSNDMLSVIDLRIEEHKEKISRIERDVKQGRDTQLALFGQEVPYVQMQLIQKDNIKFHQEAILALTHLKGFINGT